MVEILIDAIQRQKIKNNFKNCLYVVFKHINLPSPTPIQYAIADELQYGDNDTVIEGFRGVAKSTITGIYADWLLDNDPENCQILNVSANQDEAMKFMKFSRSLLNIVPFWNYLRPIDRVNRDSALQFDVAPAETRVQPSCKALGIMGQLTGNRATHIIADDIETSVNCRSQVDREKIEEATKEFRQILIPDRPSRLIYLGTPHTEVSIYNKLYDKGHKVRIFPILYPNQEQILKYGDKLAPYIKEKVEQDPTLVGTSTDPIRFNEQAILKLESEGRSKFAMQQMLDTTLSDIERYPLKCSDLIVIDCDKDIAPERVAYGSAANQVIKDVPCCGIGADKYYAPMPLPDVKWVEYQYKTMTIDPSGRGTDELAYDIGGVLNARIFLLKQGGLQGGYCEKNLYTLANLAKEYKVNKITIESNFGDGMFTTLFSPILKKVNYECGVEEIRHNTQKEKRIIDTLEPVMNQHRLIIDKQLILDDKKSTECYPLEKQQQYSLFYQMTRMTRDRGCLIHDDRIDCLAMLVKDCLDMLQVDEDEEIRLREEAEFDAEIERVFGDTLGEKQGYSWYNL